MSDPGVVVGSVELDVPAARAFHAFTAGIGARWDRDDVDTAVDPVAGGAVVDRSADGSQQRRGTVLAHDAPHRLVVRWDAERPGTPDPWTGELDLTVTELAATRTRVTLAHRRPPGSGPGGSGWSLVPFVDRVARADRVLGRTLPAVGDDTMRLRLGAAAPYTVVLLHATPALVRPALDPVIWEHGRRNMALAEAGVLPVVLPVTDDTDLAGIGVFAATVDEVRTVMDDDPGVRAGIFRYDVHPVRGFPGACLPHPGGH